MTAVIATTPHLSSPFSLLQSLRNATSRSHRDLDAAMRLGNEPDQSDAYVAFLRASLAVLETLEPAVARFLPEHTGPSRVDALASDLASLDVAGPDAAVVTPTIANLADAYGAAYVMEGSALGGMVLARRVDAGLSLGGRSLRYLTLRGTETGTAWKRFIAELDTWGRTASPAERARSIDVAIATFAAYADACAKYGAITPSCES